MGVLVVAAIKFEVSPLLDRLEKAGIDATFEAVGIGSINAARSYERIKNAAQGKDVIYVGTCGTFGDFSKPSLVRASRALWIPPCFRSSIAWSLEGLDKPFELPEPPNWALDLKPVDVICSPTIAKSPSISEEVKNLYDLNNKDLLVENLELYSCAEGIASVSKSLVTIFGITNAVGPSGRDQWKENFKSLAELTADFVMEKISLV